MAFAYRALEYSAWAERPSLLPAIVAVREQGRVLDDAEDGAALVARLRSTGRIGETA